MKKETADLVCAALDESGVEYTRRDDYSGRGMYGKTTVGIVVGGMGTFVGAAVRAAFAMGQADSTRYGDAEPPIDPEDFAREIARVRTDNMGRSDVIVY